MSVRIRRVYAGTAHSLVLVSLVACELQRGIAHYLHERNIEGVPIGVEIGNILYDPDGVIDLVEGG